ncbi:HAD-IA family hydrolase [Luteimonas sp. 3794]|uniref:HAD-IA family hydrolase n=1 Tax=Luteimonas sp. 3794 TaxID=2817730 RepID=UPI00285E96CC|nr:HAD-IA family hydrolase [Luteimonas sp. 3794]MDR6993132.1 putative hydrolase of the HAD superfamily [Luteimonas sp. 3794]
MRTPPPVRLVLFDFDGVLARFDRAARIAVLAQHAGCTPARAASALYDSGLERAYDSGLLTTKAYLQQLGAGLGHAVDAGTWIDARVAGSHADPAALALAAAVAARVPIGVLTNNGALMADAMPRIVAPLFPALEGRVLCSGALGVRKPDAAAFARTLARLDARPAGTLLVDDVFANVQGARAAGLHAETVIDARSMRKVLRRYGLA